MLRRSFVTGVGAAAVLGVPRMAGARERALKIGVVGGGIVGASIAFHLAKAGADVTVFEKTGPAKGATQNSMAWINPFTRDRHYVGLRLESVEAWRALDIPLQLDVTWGGSITWEDDAEGVSYVRDRISAVEGTPYPVRMIDMAEMASLSPAISPDSVSAAFFAAQDGHVDPVWATYRFLDAAARFGAKVIYPCEVQSIAFRQNRVTGVVTSQGAFSLDRVIAVSGIDTPRVLAMAGFDLMLKHSPGFVARSLPIPALTKMVYDGPGKLEIKQMTNGRMVADLAGGPPDLPQHQGIRDHIMDYADEALRLRHGERVLERVRAYMPNARGMVLDEVRLGFRPMPTDGLPVVGAVPGAPEVYAVVTHSGVTLAPILGRYVSQEILTGMHVDRLSPYRPGRFAAKKSDVGRDGAQYSRLRKGTQTMDREVAEEGSPPRSDHIT